MERGQDNDELAPKPVRASDLTALIGWLAVIEGELTLARDALPVEVTVRLRERLEAAGLLARGGDERAVRQAINNLNHRLRYALGEYPAPPETSPVP
jgi:hypothetical protein